MLKKIILGSFLMASMTASFAGDFLPANDAFLFSKTEVKNELVLTWKMPPGYFLYKNKIFFSDDVTPKNWPKGKFEHDDEFGNVEIYGTLLEININKKDIKNNKLTVYYQGCKLHEICYLPQIKDITVN